MVPHGYEPKPKKLKPWFIWNQNRVYKTIECGAWEENEKMDLKATLLTKFCKLQKKNMVAQFLPAKTKH